MGVGRRGRINAPRVCGVPRPEVRTKLNHRRSEEVWVRSSCPVLPVIPLVVGLRTDFEMLRVDTEPVVAAMPDDLFPPHDGPLEDAVDEPVGVGLTTAELHFPRRGLSKP